MHKMPAIRVQDSSVCRGAGAIPACSGCFLQARRQDAQRTWKSVQQRSISRGRLHCEVL